jgi:hypothetical protein
MDAAIAEGAAKWREVTDRLDALIAVVERYISEKRNGGIQ